LSAAVRSAWLDSSGEFHRRGGGDKCHRAVSASFARPGEWTLRALYVAKARGEAKVVASEGQAVEAQVLLPA